MLRFISIICLVGLASSCATAADPNNLYRESRMDNLPKLLPGKLASDDLRVEEIMIGKSTFDDVAVKFGKAEVIKSDVEHGEVRACYRSSSKGDDTVLLLESGPMGGWKRLTTISITNTKLWKQWARCKSSPLVNRSIATASGLRIGISSAELAKHLGKPAVSDNGFVGYYLTAQEGDWTYTSIVESALENDKVVSITVHQIVTN